MGVIRFIRRLFGAEKKEQGRRGSGECQEGKQESARDACLDALVKRYIDNNMIGIPLVPQFLERKVYRSVLDFTLRSIEDAVCSASSCTTGIVFFHHRINIQINARPPEHAKHTKNQGLVDGNKQMKDKKVEEMARKFLTTAKKGPQQTNKERKAELEQHREMVKHYVDKFIDNPRINIRLLPDFVERQMYINIIEMVVGIVQDALRTSHINVLGAKITFNLEPVRVVSSSSSTPKTSVEHDADATQKQDGVDHIIQGMVETYMKENNIFLIPDVVERHFYTCAMRVVLGIMHEVLRTVEIEVFHHKLTASASPVFSVA